MSEDNHRTERIYVEGIVQGVGFRPFVHNLAGRYSLGGYVANTPDGVLIEVEGTQETLDSFVNDLTNEAPPLSRIVSVSRNVVSVQPGASSGLTCGVFEIRESIRGGKPLTLIPPDICICDECLEELFDPHDRRHLYPFINCTNCGPRFTIIRELPYDRPYTTMAGFTMCTVCLSEYDDPENRRYHAQPNACPECGPRVGLLDCEGNSISDDPVVTAIQLLREGKIVAVKGLGGFHLAVDGTNNEAVKRLRNRKNREEKPLALMTGSVKDARRLISMDSREEQILMSRERPILLVPRLYDEFAAETVAPGNAFLGVMLPYTPLHYLLFYHPDAGGNFSGDRSIFKALVMTSGNLSEEPVCRDNGEALERLSDVADAFLVHDRDIYVRCDDSVVRMMNGEIQFMRRSRGFVPVPVFLPESTAPVLAFGGELKNTLCIVGGRRAFMSQHIGDLENIPTLEFFHEAVTHFKKILDLEPSALAYDLHPDYLSTKYVMSLLKSPDAERFAAVGVQHHHAHIAGVLAEHGVDGPVIGFSADGTGYGSDGAVWGGEILLCTPYSFTRAAHLDYISMPGGTSAVREPWRMAFSYLREAFAEDWRSLNLPCLKRIPGEKLDVLARACGAGINSPPTSSLGRLFDAAASILDIRHINSFEGQAAMMLEMCATGESSSQVLPFFIREYEDGILSGNPALGGNIEDANIDDPPGITTGFIIDYRPLIRALAEAKLAGRPCTELALSFHVTVLSSFLEIAERIREKTGINTVAISGGCWQNRIMSERFSSMLVERKFNVLAHSQVPANDGGLALGQAYIASCILMPREKRNKQCALQSR